MKITPEEFENNLNQFIGTEKWHVWSILFPRFVLTDGAKYVADTAGAYWLMDVIASYQRDLLKQKETFQVWVLTVNPDHSAILVCDDGNNHALVRKEIRYTDFFLPSIKLYAIHDGSGYMTILLPSEY